MCPIILIAAGVGSTSVSTSLFSLHNCPTKLAASMSQRVSPEAKSVTLGGASPALILSYIISCNCTVRTPVKSSLYSEVMITKVLDARMSLRTHTLEVQNPRLCS